jgi:hypothetical protein
MLRSIQSGSGGGGVGSGSGGGGVGGVGIGFGSIFPLPQQSPIIFIILID